MPAVGDQDPVQALSPDGADEPLGDSVGLRRADYMDVWGAKTRSGFGTRRSSALQRSIVACSAGDPWTARKRRFRAASRGSDTRRQRPRSNKGTPQGYAGPYRATH